LVRDHSVPDLQGKLYFVTAGLYLQMNVPKGDDYSLLLPVGKIHAIIHVSCASYIQHTKENDK